jgi:hypothetical protein
MQISIPTSEIRTHDRKILAGEDSSCLRPRATTLIGLKCPRVLKYSANELLLFWHTLPRTFQCPEFISGFYEPCLIVSIQTELETKINSVA